MLSFGSDGASNFSGPQNSVKALLKNETENLFLLWCCSHILNLISSNAAKELPQWLEQFFKKLYSLFSRSPKQTALYEIFCKEKSQNAYKIKR